MSEYYGYFTVTNKWSTPISGTAEHYTTDYGVTKLSFTDLNPTKTSEKSPQFTSSTSNTDHWNISFVDGSNKQWVGLNTCAFHEDDNGGTVQLSVVFDDTEFTQVMPSGHSCDTELG